MIVSYPAPKNFRPETSCRRAKSAAVGLKFLFTTWLVAQAFSTESLAQATNSVSENKVVRIGVATTRVPYVSADATSGIEVDILRNIFSHMKAQVKFVPSKAVDLPQLITSDKVDAASGLYQMSSLVLYYSDPHMFYANQAITLKKRKIKINKLEDLKKYSVAAFPNAHFSLGYEFKTLVERHKYYTEYDDQSIQAMLLQTGRVDIVVSDIYIFNFHSKNLKLPKLEEVSYQDVFAQSNYSVAFKDSALRDAFNKALAETKRDGSHQKILDQYKENFPGK